MKKSLPGYGKTISQPTCAVCNNPCTVIDHAHMQPRIPIYRRALYFDASDNVDFCGADCSLQYYQRKIQP